MLEAKGTSKGDEQRSRRHARCTWAGREQALATKTGSARRVHGKSSSAPTSSSTQRLTSFLRNELRENSWAGFLVSRNFPGYCLETTLSTNRDGVDLITSIGPYPTVTRLIDYLTSSFPLTNKHPLRVSPLRGTVVGCC